ncbi:hypothetical protein ACFQAV_01300 [Companilactobacillus huachuanensis]|uniref:Surface layer protein A domain-containing protein n=1 Tax=Companilactobacillus huachuanensis TaxID=2559914 RepID=A0ABW1RK23_9LACO|nr:hypothetical protein [Companilactobacillus huachuanensis]
MKKIMMYLSLLISLLFGTLTLANTTTTKADSTLPSGRYDFAVTQRSQTTDMQGRVTPIVLDAGTVWKVNSEFYHGNQTYFQLAPNVLVNQNDGYMYLPEVGDLTVIRKTAAPLYDHNGKLITDRALAPGSVWYSDRAIFVDHMSFYRVATNEFVSIADVN